MDNYSQIFHDRPVLDTCSLRTLAFTAVTVG